jgi:hypothetical protein
MTKRLATNAVPRLDVFMLHRGGFLTSGAVSRWQWPLPAFPLVVIARAQGHRLFLSLNEGEEIACSIIRRPGTTGNTWPHFACTECERPVRYLYPHNGRIACRSCHDLEWPSRQPGQWDTTSRQIIRLRGQLAMLENRKLDRLSKRSQPVKRIQEAAHDR